MVYQIRIPRKWDKFIGQLDLASQKIVKTCLASISENPFNNDGKVKKYLPTTVFKRRAGDYRILYMIAKKIKIVDIIKIGHRKNVYD
jgi:mRNA interferase RelE/StbE